MHVLTFKAVEPVNHHFGIMSCGHRRPIVVNFHALLPGSTFGLVLTGQYYGKSRTKCIVLVTTYIALGYTYDDTDLWNPE